MILYGKNSVYERLLSNPKSIEGLFLEKSFHSKDITRLINKNNISCERISLHRLRQLNPVDSHQGIMAEVGDFSYAHFDSMLIRLKGTQPTFIFLDRIFDPQNLGAIMRTAACFGSFCIVIPKHKACSITEAVLHVASGGENYVPVAMVSNLSNAIIKAKDKGFWIVGAVVDEGAQDLTNVSLPFPLGIVLGSEGDGVRYGVDKHLDVKVRIPMKGAAISFNVTTAATILCYEIIRQRALKKI